MAEQPARAGRPRIDVVTLLFGIAALVFSATTLTDGTSWFPDVDPRLVLAAAAVLVGIVLLAGALRRPRGE